MTKRALVIYNPVSKMGAQPDLWVGKLIKALSRLEGYIVTLYATSSDTTPQTLGPFLKPPLDLVIAAGGDGTVRFALAALAEAKSQIPAAIIPLGTGNVLARNLGIMNTDFFADPMLHAFEGLFDGTPTRIDLGMMNGEYFAGMAGAGPISNAFVVPGRQEKTAFKLFAYVRSMLISIAKRPIVFNITTGGKSFKVQASGVFVSNVPNLGLGNASQLDLLSDGLLSLQILKPRHFQDYLDVGFHFVGGYLESGTPHYVSLVKEAMIEVAPRRGLRSHFQNGAHKLLAGFGKTIKLPPTNSHEVAAMLDGDYFGTTPMRITVIPNAVTVMVPRYAAAKPPQLAEAESKKEELISTNP